MMKVHQLCISLLCALYSSVITLQDMGFKRNFPPGPPVPPPPPSPQQLPDFLAARVPAPSAPPSPNYYAAPPPSPPPPPPPTPTPTPTPLILPPGPPPYRTPLWRPGPPPLVYTNRPPPADHHHDPHQLPPPWLRRPSPH